jgi:hypothetical protein
MQRLLRLALILLALLPAAAGRAAPPADLSERMLVARGLPLLTLEGVKVYHSPGARAVAELHGAALAEALAWYRAMLGWQGTLTAVVLDQADWLELVALPYPVPHAQRRWDLVVMPDSIARFPGFPAWDFDDRALTLALTFHEVGHLIAPQLGLASGNHWVEELVANLFLAAYDQAERPDLAAILAGVPPRFANPGPFDQLFDLDSFYAGGGLENYAWFQFRLAALAGRMVEGRGFAEVIAAMRAAFPAEQADRRLTLPRTLALVDKIAPGATLLVADMAGDGVLPALAPQPCGASQPAAAAKQSAGRILFDNRGTAPLGYRAAGAPAFTLLPAGEVASLEGLAGTPVELQDGGCLTLPAGAARYSVGTGGTAN